MQRDRGRRHGGPADAVEAVAAGDEVRLQFVAHAVFQVGEAGRGGVDAMHRHFVGLVHRGQVGGAAGGHQVAGDLGLAIDHHPLAGEPEQVDAVALASETQLHAIVRQAFGVQALGDAGGLQQVDGGLLQHAGADAAEHVARAALLDHDVGDARLRQQLAEQQARGAGADDGNLGFHGVVSDAV